MGGSCSLPPTSFPSRASGKGMKPKRDPARRSSPSPNFPCPLNPHCPSKRNWERACHSHPSTFPTIPFSSPICSTTQNCKCEQNFSYFFTFLRKNEIDQFSYFRTSPTLPQTFQLSRALKDVFPLPCQSANQNWPHQFQCLDLARCLYVQ